MKRKTYLLPALIILVTTLFNGILFYSTKCSVEYMQTKNVWGASQFLRLSDYRRQQKLLSQLPKDPSRAEESLDVILASLQKLSRIQSSYLSEKRKEEELSEGREEFLSKPYVTDIQENDLSNYLRLRELLSGAAQYAEYREAVVQGADDVASLLFPIRMDERCINNALQCKRDYATTDPLYLMPALDNSLNLVLQYHPTDLLAFLMLVLMSLVLYDGVRKQSSDPAVSVRSLEGTFLFFSLTGLLCLYLSNLLITRSVFGLPSFFIPIQSLEAFYTCPYSITVGAFLCLWLLLKICTQFLLLFLCLLALSGKRPRLSMLLVLFFLAGEFCLSNYDGFVPFKALLREINLFSGMTAERFFNRYLTVGFTVQALPRLRLFLVCFTLPLLALTVLFFRRLRGFWETAGASLQKKYFEEIDKRYQETRRLWHDFNNHLLTIKALYGTGQAREAENYIEALSLQSRQNLLPAKTGSNAVDLLLFQKSQTAKELRLQITFTIACDLKKYSFREYDLCSILGNLLDNAMEASSEFKEGAPEILLRMEEQGGMLFLSCQNGYLSERKRKGNQLLTTKKDAANHGMGLLSVERICRKYGGSMEILARDGKFLVTLLLNGK